MSTKVWIVTGAGSGMGNRLVHQILARKDKVIATTRNLKDLEEFAANEDAYIMELDVTDTTGNIRGKITEAVKIWGRIDVLVGNAGAAHKILMEDAGSEGLEKQYQLNVFGPMNVIYAVLPFMRERRSGTIVLVGSRSAIRNEFPGIGPYASSKAALHSLGETLAVEVRPFNIRVMILQPGAFRTEGLPNYPFPSTGSISDYDETRKAAAIVYHTLTANPDQAGDPMKGMSLLVDVVRGEGAFEGREFPLWLALGSDSERDYRERVSRIVESLDTNSDISNLCSYGA